MAKQAVSGKSILIVEDDAKMRQLLQVIIDRDKMLRYHGLKVIAVSDGDTALEAFDDNKPSLVVCDLLLPKTDGESLIETLRRRPCGQDVPIIVISGAIRSRQIIDRLQRQFSVEFLAKPFNPAVFAKKVRQLLRKDSTERVASSQLNSADSTAKDDHRNHPISADPECEAAETEPLPDASGLLSKTDLSDLLLCAYESHWTGVLEVSRRKIEKKIFLFQGHPVFVESNVRVETLGQLLVGKGVITAEDDERALALASKEGRRYGEALLTLGSIEEEELFEQLVAQTRVKIERMIRWREGKWSFRNDVGATEHVPHCTVSPVDVIFEGFKKHVDAEEAVAIMATLTPTSRAVPLDRFFAYRDAFTRVFGDALCAQIAANTRLSEIAIPQLTPTDLAIQLEVLLICRMVSLIKAGEEDSLPLDDERAQAQRNTAAELLSVSQLATGTRENKVVVTDDYVSLRSTDLSQYSTIQTDNQGGDVPKEIRRRINGFYLQIKDATAYGILGVEDTANTEQIEAAYVRLREEFSIDRFKGVQLGTTRNQIEEIRLALRGAFDMLSDDNRRREYDTHLTQMPVQSARRTSFAAERAFRKGSALIDEGHFSEAVQALHSACYHDIRPEYQVSHALAAFHERGATIEAAADAMLVIQSCIADYPDLVDAHVAAAELCRLTHAFDEAILHLRSAVDLDPDCRDAFDRLETLLLQRDELSQLETIYRQLLFRLGASSETWVAELWRRLTWFYFNTMKNDEQARIACAKAMELNPREPALRELAEQLERKAAIHRWPNVVSGYQALLRDNPGEPELLLALWNMHIKAKRAHAAYTVASVAVGYGIRNNEFVQYLGCAEGQLRAVETDRLHDSIHSSKMWYARGDLEEITHLILPFERAFVDAFADDPAMDIAADECEQSIPAEVCEIARSVSGILNVQQVNIVLQKEPGIIARPTVDGAILQLGSDVLLIKDSDQLRFIIARELFFMCKGYRLLRRLSTDQLTKILQAIVGYVDDQCEIRDPLAASIVSDVLLANPQLKRHCSERLETLRSRFDRIDVVTWGDAVWYNANRAGLIVCGSPQAAVEVAKADSDRGVELVDFALGETYWQIRCKLFQATG